MTDEIAAMTDRETTLKALTALIRKAEKLESSERGYSITKKARLRQAGERRVARPGGAGGNDRPVHGGFRVG